MQKDIKENPLWVIKSTEQKNGTGGTELRVVQWVVDGKPGTAMLEKRDYFFTEDGERKAGKAKGFTAFDLMAVLESIHRIGELLKIPKNVLAEQLVAATMGTETPSTASPSASPKTAPSRTPRPAGTSPAAGPASGPPDVEF